MDTDTEQNHIILTCRGSKKGGYYVHDMTFGGQVSLIKVEEKEKIEFGMGMIQT